MLLRLINTNKGIRGGAVRCGLWLESRKEIVRTIRIHATDRVLQNCGLWLKYKKGKKCGSPRCVDGNRNMLSYGEAK